MKKTAFTILEMMLVLLVISVILLLVIPNIVNKQTIIKEKGCQAQIEIINSQILLFEIEFGKMPNSIQELIDSELITAKQSICATGEQIEIVDGQAQT